MAPDNTLFCVMLVALWSSWAAAAPACSGNPAAVLNAAPWSCADTEVGATCTATCRTGYGGPTPVTALCGIGGVWAAPVGKCSKVCTTQPPAELLVGGVWPPTCAGTIAVGARCVGECTGGLVGLPSIMCTVSGWVAASLAGQCAPPPACSTLPSRVPANAQPWPATCAGTTSGGTCRTSCNANYQARAPPTITCTAGVWSQPSPPMCYFGQPPSPSPALEPSPSPALEPSPSPLPVAVIADWKSSRLVMCRYDASAPAFSDCVQHSGGSGLTFGPISFATPIAGNRVLLLVSQGSLYSCAWSRRDLSLSDCIASSANGLWASANRDGTIAFDAANGITYISEYFTSKIIACTNATALTGCSIASDNSAGSPISNPVGLTVAGSTLVVSSVTPAKTVYRCPIGPAGLNLAGCAASTVAFSPVSTAVADGRSWVAGLPLGVFTNVPSLMTVCGADGSGCTAPLNGEGLFSYVRDPGFTAIYGIAVHDGRLLVPNAYVPRQGVVVCSSPATVSGCTLVSSFPPLQAGPNGFWFQSIAITA